MTKETLGQINPPPSTLVITPSGGTRVNHPWQTFAGDYYFASTLAELHFSYYTQNEEHY